MQYAVLALAAVLLTGCEDDHAPRWEDVCVHETVQFTRTHIGKLWILRSTPVCDTWDRQCTVGPDFKGYRKACLPENR